MVVAHCTTATFHFTTTTISDQFCKKPWSISSIYISNPKRLTNRKNYLRRKLLKTLIKPPYPSPLIEPPPPPNSEINLLPSSEKELKFPSPGQFSGEFSPYIAGEEFNGEEVEQSDASESIEIVGENVGNFPKNPALKFGLWLAGAFVFQTICAVWVFKSSDSGNQSLEIGNEKIDRKTGKGLGNDESRLKHRVNWNVYFGDKGNLSANEDELVKKIEEITIMAREAREKERVERKKTGLDGNESDFEDEEGDDGVASSEIEKQVFERLDKLRKRFEKDREKFSVGYVKGEAERKVGVDKNRLVNETNVNEGLVFKKKYKFKGSLNEERRKPKGFSGVSDHGDGTMGRSSTITGNEVSPSGTYVDGGVNMLSNKHALEPDLHEGNVSGNVMMDFEDVRRRNQKPEASGSLETVKQKFAEDKVGRRQGKRVHDVTAKSRLFKVQDKNYATHSVETGKSRETSIPSSDRQDRSLKNRGSRHKQSARIKEQDCDTDWWLSLPYILVVLMQQSRNGGGQRGLYTLKGPRYAADESSHIVAFTDRGDATNFCYLLQSFFEDLEDFSTDVVPLSIKELKELMKSQNKKVIVVKKGQVQLYAGQPLADVEMALHSLVE